MAIGTGNITLQEVTTEIYGDTNAGRNLVTCFADATGTFNATYEGSKDRLSNFKGYSQADITPPTAPTLPFATAIMQTTFTLTWTNSTDNVAVTGYKIYKGGVLYIDAGNVLTYNITGQTAGATNTWTVKAYDAAGNLSAASPGKSVTQTAASTSYSSSSGTGSDACGITKNQTYYHNGVNALPVVNDTCYSNSGMTTTLAANHYSVGGGPGQKDLTINSSGVVTAVSGCGDPGGGGGGGGGFGGGGF